MGRPWLKLIWERSFATEDEADEAYERMLEGPSNVAPLETDRYDGHTVRLYLDQRHLEAKAQLVESEFVPTTITCYCACGHIAAAHKGEESSCTVERCACRAYERDGKR